MTSMRGPDQERRSLRRELREVYDTYDHYSLRAKPPAGPTHWKKKGERAALIFLGMPLLPVALLRLRNSLVRCGVPLVPYFCDILNNTVWGVSIGRDVKIGPGLYLPHGHVVIDGIVDIGRDCVVNPWVTIGLSGRRKWGFDPRGPMVGDRVFIGSGAKILGPITVGDDARIGANSVVIDDVPQGETVVGSPARVVHEGVPPPWVTAAGSSAGEETPADE